jgi:hypothetical protein
MDNPVALKFVNSDATPKMATIRCAASSVAKIMDWYGAFHGGDRYAVYVNGVKARKDGNGSLVGMLIVPDRAEPIA